MCLSNVTDGTMASFPFFDDFSVIIRHLLHSNSWWSVLIEISSLTEVTSRVAVEEMKKLIFKRYLDQCDALAEPLGTLSKLGRRRQ